MIWFRINNQILDLTQFQHMWTTTQRQTTTPEEGSSEVMKIYGSKNEKTQLIWSGVPDTGLCLFDRMWGAIASTIEGYNPALMETEEV